jgi:hypothetical protein
MIPYNYRDYSVNEIFLQNELKVIESSFCRLERMSNHP